MEAWIVVYVLQFGGVNDERRAVGHFPNQKSCIGWFHHFQKFVDREYPNSTWLGTCYTEAEVKERWPELKLGEH